MKNKIFLLGVASLLLWTSCTKESGQESEQPVVNDPVFTLTSETTVAVAATGERVELTYTIENPTSSGVVDATSDASWITDFNLQSYGVVAFEVATNENEEERNATVTLSYEDQTYTVEIQQAAGEVGIGSDYVRTAEDLNGFYYDLLFGDVPNYYFTLSNVGFNEAGQALPNGWFYCIDLYSQVVPEYGSTIHVPNAVYELDTHNTYAAGTFSIGYSLYYVTDENGDALSEATFSSGTLTVTDDSIVLLMTDKNGETHKVTYEGNNYALYDMRDQPGDPDDPEDVFSNLTGDVEVDSEGWYNVASYYGDYYKNGGGNWLLAFYPENNNGDFVQLDLVVDELGVDADLSGTYTCADSSDPFYFMLGTYYEGYLLGSWYAVMVDGAIGSGAYAPFKSGTMEIAKQDNGAYTFTLEAFDDQEEPNKITATWTAALSVKDYSNQPPRPQQMKLR